MLNGSYVLLIFVSILLLSNPAISGSVKHDNANCLDTLLNKKRAMWWQGVNSGSPKNHGYAEFKLVGASDPGNAIFNGKFYSGGNGYNIHNGKISGNTFYFETTTFDRPGATGRESKLKGSGKCGQLGNLGSFEFVWAVNDHDDTRPLYKYNFEIEASK